MIRGVIAWMDVKMNWVTSKKTWYDSCMLVAYWLQWMRMHRMEYGDCMVLNVWMYTHDGMQYEAMRECYADVVWMYTHDGMAMRVLCGCVMQSHENAGQSW